jgi:hypothetical protein
MSERQKTALVGGAGGFIDSHLVKRLVKDGYWVRGADQKRTEFSPTAAHDFHPVDLRDLAGCEAAVRTPSGEPFDEVYQLAADMGGMGFIHSAECEIMRNSCLVNPRRGERRGRGVARRRLAGRGWRLHQKRIIAALKSLRSNWLVAQLT